MLLSIIVPIYNGKKTLLKCIDSLLKQCFMDIEVICIDDGSTDDSLSICQNIAEYAPLKDQYHLPLDVGFRLIQNTCALEEKEVGDSVVYIWSEAGESRQRRQKAATNPARSASCRIFLFIHSFSSRMQPRRSGEISTQETARSTKTTF